MLEVTGNDLPMPGSPRLAGTPARIAWPVVGRSPSQSGERHGLQLGFRLPSGDSAPDTPVRTSAADAIATRPPDAADVANGLNALVRRLAESHAPAMAPLPPVRVSRRMTRTLGSFRPDRRQISLSSRLLTFGSEEHIRTVLLHEVAHAIVHYRDAGARAHGALFRAVCGEIGVVPKRFVDVPVANWASRLRYVFTCAACGVAVVRKRLLRMARCACGARLEVQRAARVAVDDGGRVVRVEGYARPRGHLP